jgi:hypothetical protein
MAIRTYSLRLEGLSVPAGEISLSDLATIGASLQLAATRIARQVVGVNGRGRTPSYLDKISELRLTSLGRGSTVLELELGDEEVLPVPDGEEAIFMQRFEESFKAVATNRPPEWAGPLVRSALGRLVTSLTSIGAATATASWSDGTRQSEQVITVPELDDTVWDVATERREEEIAMTGVLDKVDLRARRFRVQDDLGNDVILEDVVDVGAAAQLIGRRVIARGTAERREGRLARIIEPNLSPELLPEEWSTSIPLNLPIAGRPVPGGVPGVTATEVDEFLSGLRA